MERRRSMTVWKDHQSVCLLSVKTALISKDNEISTALDFLHSTIKKIEDSQLEKSLRQRC